MVTEALSKEIKLLSVHPIYILRRSKTKLISLNSKLYTVPVKSLDTLYQSSEFKGVFKLLTGTVSHQLFSYEGSFTVVIIQ